MATQHNTLYKPIIYIYFILDFTSTLNLNSFRIKTATKRPSYNISKSLHQGKVLRKVSSNHLKWVHHGSQGSVGSIRALSDIRRQPLISAVGLDSIRWFCIPGNQWGPLLVANKNHQPCLHKQMLKDDLQTLSNMYNLVSPITLHHYNSCLFQQGVHGWLMGCMGPMKEQKLKYAHFYSSLTILCLQQVS